MSLFTRIWQLATKTASSNNDYYIEVDKQGEESTEKMAVNDIVQNLGLDKSKLSITNGNEIDISDVELTTYERHGGRLFNEVAIKPERITLSTDLKINVEGNIVFLKNGFFKLFRDEFVAGEGNGGLDRSTAINNKTFDIYIIASSDLGDVDMLFVPEDETPIMPTGFVFKQFFSKYKTSYNYFGATTGILIDNLYQTYDFSDGKLKENFVKNHINGFEITKENTTKIKIDIGQCRDYNNENNIVQNSFAYKTTATYQDGNENGMFERDIEKETLYYIYILKLNNGRLDYMASTYPPASFCTSAHFRNSQLIGYLRTDDNLDFYCWNWSDPQTFIAVKSYASGTNGGDTVTGWNLINLNVVKSNYIAGASLNTTEKIITLPKGVYNITAKTAVYNIFSYLSLKDSARNEITCSLRTDSTNSGITMVNSINCEMILEGDYTLELYSKQARTNGLGKAINITGIDELYAGIMFKKIK